MKLLLLMLVLFAASGADTNCGKSAALNKQITLKYGQTIEVREQNLRIKFAAVSEDSRCPRGEQCIRAGNGRIDLEITKDGKVTNAALNTADEPREFATDGVAVALVELRPYPQSGVDVKTEEYEAVLEIRKASDKGTSDTPANAGEAVK